MGKDHLERLNLEPAKNYKNCCGQSWRARAKRPVVLSLGRIGAVWYWVCLEHFQTFAPFLR